MAVKTAEIQHDGGLRFVARTGISSKLRIPFGVRIS